MSLTGTRIFSAPQIEKLSHSVKIIGDFSKLGIEPPLTRTAVAQTVEELRAKKVEYLSRFLVRELCLCDGAHERTCDDGALLSTAA